MLLVIDAGNTNVAFALYAGRDKQGEWRCATDARKTADEYAVWLFELLRLAGTDRDAISRTIIASVVPDATFNLRRFCELHCGCTPLVIGEPSCRLPLEVRTDRPAEVGADRLVNAVAAREAYGAPAVVLDFGTATTFDIVDRDGAYAGGIIAPGPNLSMAALHHAAAKLPHVDISKPDTVIGRNTVSAMQSGVFWGYVGLIEGLLARIFDELGYQPPVIATGGLGRLFSAHIPFIGHYDPDLTMSGLCLIYHLNAKSD